jgi:hypothetical protein
MINVISIKTIKNQSDCQQFKFRPEIQILKFNHELASSTIKKR